MSFETILERMAAIHRQKIPITGQVTTWPRRAHRPVMNLLGPIN